MAAFAPARSHSPARGSTRRRAFTLIELLLVASIIALLAAIAMVNAHQAIVRAKAAHARSDIRVIGAALEAYMADWDNLPLTSSNVLAPWAENFIRDITTPVAYIGSDIENFIDPFVTGSRDDAVLIAGDEPRYWSSHYRLLSGGPRFNQGPMNRRDSYFIYSLGPAFNRPARARVHFEPSLWLGLESIGAWSVDHPSTERLGILPYDPTNGVSSIGMIYRIGARVPQWFVAAQHPMSN
jgi:prepilin-type N-terminal cleavage/methylation domain-containing protein